MDKKEKMKILLIADQPWQTEVLLRVSKEISSLYSQASFDLAVCDYYMFRYTNTFLNGIKSAFHGKVFTQEKNFLSWNNSDNHLDYDDDFIKKWEQNYCQNISLSELFASHSLVNSFENEQYYHIIPEKWHKKIIYDTNKWIEDVITLVKPEICININNFLYESYAFYLVAKQRKIMFLSIIPSRIQSGWSFRDDLGYGMSHELLTHIKTLFNSDRSLELTKDLEVKLKENLGIYNSISNELSKKFSVGKFLGLRMLMSDLRRYLSRIYSRFFIESVTQRNEIKLFSENHIKLTFLELRILLIHNFRRFGVRIWGKNSVPKKKYFLWTLHVRPESSVMILGDAADEIEQIEEVAALLPDGYYLAVKENPIMFGMRRYGFYTRLRKNKKIILIDPFMSTVALIANSMGVIGSSGTSLLEAAVMDVPSFALGKPEFSPFLMSNEFNNISEFIAKCLSGEKLNSQVLVSPYIGWLSHSMDPSDLPFLYDLKSSETDAFITSLTRRIILFIRNKDQVFN
jgi:hypothetical protein